MATPKYQQLFQSLKADILAGRYRPGKKLPSEAALVVKSGASRITVGRALRELQNLGLIERVAGSGSFVRDLQSEAKAYLFGLLIPDLGDTEIFEPICRGIANAPAAIAHGLLWGHVEQNASKPEQAWRLCTQYIEKRLAGVFFAPLEFERSAGKMNRRIVAELRDAGIATVLLDRRNCGMSGRKRPDLVGTNHRQAAYIATEHLIEHGCRRIGFLSYSGAEGPIQERMAGYRDALREHHLRPALDDVTITGLVGQKENRLQAADGFVCVNDRVAGEFMHLYLRHGRRIPKDMRLVGIDDVSYASLLPVPLTTVRQPVAEIGEAALQMMLDRIRSPHLPPREMLLDGELVVRRSCGAT